MFLNTTYCFCIQLFSTVSNNMFTDLSMIMPHKNVKYPVLSFNGSVSDHFSLKTDNKHG